MSEVLVNDVAESDDNPSQIFAEIDESSADSSTDTSLLDEPTVPDAHVDSSDNTLLILDDHSQPSAVETEKDVTISVIPEAAEQDKLMVILRSDFISCVVCTRNSGDLKLLPCLHVACENCISPQPANWFCQGCQKLTDSTDQPLPYTIPLISQLPKAVFMDGLHRLSQLIEPDVEHACDQCKLDSLQWSVAESRCVECGENLCDQCTQAHRRTKLTRAHTLLAFSDIPGLKSLAQIHQEPLSFCMSKRCASPSLQAAEATSYCHPCQQLLCSKCSGGSFKMANNCNGIVQSKEEVENRDHHQGHQLTPIFVTVTGVKSELQRCIEAVQQRRDVLKKYSTELADYGVQLESTKQMITEDINVRAASLHKEIDRIAREMKTEVDKQVNHELAQVNRLLRPLSPIVAQCDYAERFSLVLHDYSRPEELLLSNEYVIQRLKVLAEQELKGLPCRLVPTFTPGVYEVEPSIDTNSRQDGTSSTSTAEVQQKFFGHLTFRYEQAQSIGDLWHPTCALANPKEDTENTVQPSSSRKADSVSIGTNTCPLPFDNSQKGSSLFDQDSDVSTTNTKLNVGPSKRQYSYYDNGQGGVDALPSRHGLKQLQQPVLNREDILISEFEFDARVSTDSRDVWPTGLAVEKSSSSIYIVDRDNARIKIFRPDGTFLAAVADTGEKEARLRSPFDVALISDNKSIAVSDYQLDEVRIYTTEGHYQGILTKERLRRPRGITFGLGLIVVVDSGRGQLALYDPREGPGTIATRRIPLTSNEISNGLGNSRPRSSLPMPSSLWGGAVASEPYYVEVIEEGSGYLALTDWAAPNLRLYSISHGNCLTTLSSGAGGLDKMVQPYGIAYTPWNRRIVVADHVNHRLQSTQITRTSANLPYYLKDEITSTPISGIRRSFHEETLQTTLEQLSPVASRKSNEIWHPMALAVDEKQRRVIVSEALGSIKVFKAEPSQ